jgi:hypothetical protein
MSLAARPSALGPADTNLQVNAIFLCVIEAVKNRAQKTYINCDKRKDAWHYSRVRYGYHGQAVIRVDHECTRTDESIGMLKSSLG